MPADFPMAQRLEDLPAHRQLLMLWHRSGSPEFPDVSASFDSGLIRCDLEYARMGEGQRADFAQLGSDGRLHLVVAGSMTCPDGSHHHDCLHWWTDGESYRTHAPGTWDGTSGPEDPDTHSLDLTWRVQLDPTDERREPHRVPKQWRCPLTAQWWPIVPDTSALGRIRARLLDTFGPHCMICETTYARAIDHDGITGCVRGYLCRRCNALAERCIHLAGCPYAEYLNDPPAAGWELTHPGHKAMLRKHRDRRKRFDTHLEQQAPVPVRQTGPTTRRTWTVPQQREYGRLSDLGTEQGRSASP